VIANRIVKTKETTSVEDPDPHVFRHPGSGSEVWIQIRILPFSHQAVERTEIMLAKILAKN
jgi:hypothetical protein